MNQVEGVGAELLEPDRAYCLMLRNCTCALHNCGYVSSSGLCRRSGAGILPAPEALWPDRPAAVEAEKTILDGADQCSFHITLA